MKLFKSTNQPRGKTEEKEPYAKCKKGAHRFGPTLDPWYDKCYNCPALRKNLSIKVKSAK